MSQQQYTKNGDRWWPFDECPGWLEHYVKNEDGTPKEGKHEVGTGNDKTYSVSFSDKYKRWAIYENKKGKWKKEFGPGIPQTGRLSKNIPTTIDDTTTSSTAGTTQTTMSEGAKKGHEENLAMHAERKQWHEETIKKLDDLNFNIVDLTAAIRELLRKEKEK